MKKLCSLLAFLVALTIGVNGVSACENCPHKTHTPPPHAKMKTPPKRLDIDKELNLTAEQKAKLKAHQEESRAKLAPIREKRMKNKAKFEEVKNSKMTDSEKQAKYNELKAEAKDLRKQANVIREEDRKFFESILDNTQKAKFEKIKAKQKKEMDKRRKAHRKPFPTVPAIMPLAK